MHPQVRQDHPGTCPICGGMKLVPEDEVQKGTSHTAHSGEGNWLKTYQPLLTIVGLILLPVLALAWRDALAGSLQWMRSMQMFMAGFFLVFSGFKFLDLPGFADGYATYDLLARRLKAYGYIYPFLELGLGLAYLTGYRLDTINIVTLVLMLFSGLGVADSIIHKRKFQCACLGTVIKVPLTTVTLVEDFGMAAMAALMLWNT